MRGDERLLPHNRPTARMRSMRRKLAVPVERRGVCGAMQTEKGRTARLNLY